MRTVLAKIGDWEVRKDFSQARPIAENLSTGATAEIDADNDLCIEWGEPPDPGFYTATRHYCMPAAVLYLLLPSTVAVDNAVTQKAGRLVAEYARQVEHLRAENARLRSDRDELIEPGALVECPDASGEPVATEVTVTGLCAGVDAVATISRGGQR